MALSLDRRWLPPILAFGVLGWMVAHRIGHPFPGGLWDLYPLYHGAENLLDYGDAYRQDAPEPSGLGRVGNPYPLNAVLVLGLPLASLPAEWAGLLYTALVGAAWIASIAYARQSQVWLLWWPMWDALRLQQASAVITVAALTALGAAQRGHRWAFVASICVLTLKPQQTLVLALYLVWLRRQWWREVAVACTLLLVATFVAQPNWLAAWLDRVLTRTELVQGELWLGLVLVPVGVFAWVRGWRLSATAVMSTGLAPWPIAGQYVASIWPIGLPRVSLLVACLGAWLGGLGTLLSLGYWVLPGSMIVAMVLAWVASPPDRSAETLWPSVRHG